ncbi:MAG: Flp pilus assembly complex ATPase component TadA [Rhodomicrobium sp.]|nr:Flp pilus assembly complex ATPase component TadA [Rhodomicrobium sp.]
MDREKLHRLLRLGIEKGASDIHFQVGNLPLYRFNGNLVELRYKVLSAQDTEAMASLLMEGDPRARTEFNEVDLAYELPSEGRFRVQHLSPAPLLQHRAAGDPAADQGLRRAESPERAPRHRPDAARARTRHRRDRHGKSTTLAAMINEVNRQRKCKIVTIEDPIEFVFTHEKAIISQREIGADTESFPTALRAALRQDPDVIMVGEMRDLETVDTSLKAAETGHLVFSTIHTADVASTINRLVSFFPVDEQAAVRNRIADNVRAIISLRLLVNKKEDARVPAVEVLRSTRSIQECIRDAARTAEITDYLARSRPERMQTFDQHLLGRRTAANTQPIQFAFVHEGDADALVLAQFIDRQIPGDARQIARALRSRPRPLPASSQRRPGQHPRRRCARGSAAGAAAGEGPRSQRGGRDQPASPNTSRSSRSRDTSRSSSLTWKVSTRPTVSDPSRSL